MASKQRDDQDLREDYKATQEKTASVVTVSEPFVGDQRGAHPAEWNPGFLARFPWLGLGSLFMVLVCLAGSVVTLCVSNGKSQTHWPKLLPPNVIIQGLSAAQTILFGIAVSTGITITWWRKVLKGSTIKDLHQSWEFSSSLARVIFAGSNFNLIALAAITTKIIVIDGILLQSAHDVITAPNAPVDTHLWVFASKDIPITGEVETHYGGAGDPTQFVANSIKTWQQSPRVMRSVAFDGCTGLCHTNVPAAGFEWECKHIQSKSITVGESHNERTTYDPMFQIEFSSVQTLDPSDTTQYLEPYIDLILGHTVSNYSTNLNITDGCPGIWYSQRCKLWPAVVSYPVTVANYSGDHTKSTVTLESSPFSYDLRQQGGYKVIERLSPAKVVGSGTPLGGLVWQFQDHFGSKATMKRDVSLPFLMQSGKAAEWQVKAKTWTCAYEFANPLEYDNGAKMPILIDSINQIMFGLATDINVVEPEHNHSTSHKGAWQRVAGTERIDSVHYITNYPYLFGAVALSLVCVLLVLPTYYGFWQLGRRVTLGPLEIAHAFRSPILVNPSDRRGSIDGVIESVGHHLVQLQTTGGVVAVANPNSFHPVPGSLFKGYQLLG